MKKLAKRACATILASTILTSMFSLSSISALATEVSTESSTQANVQAETENDVQNEAQSDSKDGKIEFFGPTGDLTLEDGEYAEGVEIISTPAEYYNAAGISTYSLRSTITLPESCDNSNQKYFPSVGNQGSIGSCTTWAQGYYQFSYAVHRKLDRIGTYQNSFSPKFIYNLVNGGEDEGSSNVEVYDLLMKNGAPSLETLPYDSDCFTWKFDEAVWQEAAKYKVKSYQQLWLPQCNGMFITSADDSDLDVIKAALANGELLAYSTCVYSWEYSNLKVNSDAPENEKYAGEYVATHMDGTEGGHRMTIVGYNDNIWTDINNNDKVDDGEMGAFKIVNSWGTSYANDGFAWVAYDALNSTSSVKGVEVSSTRERIFNTINRIEIEEKDSTSNVFLKYTVNSATRTKTPIEIVAERYNTKVKKYIVPYNVTFDHNLFGEELSYNGTDTASDATFLADLTQYFPEINSYNISEYSISINFKDTDADSNVLTVKDVEIIDTYKNVTYQPTSFNQFTLDGSEKTVDIIKNTDKTAIVYYKGYYMPNIEYKTENGSWVSAPGYEMQLTTDVEGYSHKYVIHLDDAEDYALVRFNNGDGTYDTNGGSYYTANEGINYFETPGVTPPEITLTYTTDLPDDGIVDVGEYTHFKMNAQGGFAPYIYKYTAYKAENNELYQREYFSSSDMRSVWLDEVGDYTVVLTVKDQAGNQATATVDITVKELNTELDYFTVTPETDIYVGDVCLFQALTSHEPISYGVNEYKIEIYNFDLGIFCSTLDLNTQVGRFDGYQLGRTAIYGTWIPEGSGNYIAYLTVKDGEGNYAYSSLPFTVSKPPVVIDSFNVSPDGKGGFFEIANMTANASGGIGELQYQFSYRRYGQEYIIQDYSTDNTASYQFGIDTGNYDLIVRVKDSLGTVSTTQKTFTVLQTYISEFEFSNNSASTGDTITIIPTIKNDSSVLRPENYTYTVTKDGVTQTLNTTSYKSTLWTPKETGTYTIKLEIRYSDTLVSVLSKNYEVTTEGIVVNSFDVSPYSEGGFFEIANMSVDASSTAGGLKYQFISRLNGQEKLVQDYSTSNTATTQFGTETGSHTLIVNIEDAAGNTRTAFSSFRVLQTNISELSFSDDSAKVGDTIKITPTIENESSVIKAENYIYTVTKDGETETLTTSSDKTTSWTPAKSGTYTVQLEIKYADTLVAVLTKEYEVASKPLIASLTVSPEQQSGEFEDVKLSVTATGGSGEYEYKFYYRKDGNEYTIQDFSSSNTATVNLSNETGYYDFYVIVKDSDGSNSNAQQLFILRDTYINNLAFSSDTVKVGETVKITPTVEYEASVIEAEHYIYTVMKNGVTERLTTSNDKTVSWTPTEAGEYTVRLEIVYSYTQVASFSTTYVVAEAPDKDTTIYFIPSEDWKQADARFAVYAWNGDVNEWASLTETDGVYVAELSDEYSNVIFCRLNPSTTENNWTNVWNQTADLTKPEDKNCFTVNAGEWSGANGTWSEYIPPTKGVSVVGDIDLTLEETDTDIYTGVIELQAGTYSFNVDHNGTTLGLNYTYTDTAVIDYSAGYKAATTFIASGGRYTFTYNATTKKLTIKFKSFDDIVELVGDINAELVRPNKNTTVFTGTIRLEAGTYSFNVNEHGEIFGVGYTFSDSIYNIPFSYKAAATFNATGGIYSVRYDSSNNQLKILKAPEGLGDVSIFGDISLPLAAQGNGVYSAQTILDAGSYDIRVDSFGTFFGNGTEFTNTVNVEFKSEWKAAATLKVTEKMKFTFTFDTNTNKVKVFNAPIDTTKVKVAFDDIDALILTSADGVNYTGTVSLEAGTYTFRMDEFGTPMGGKYTFTDSSNNMVYNATYASATTMTATGGTYTFSYNVNTDTLKVTKA